MDSCIALAKRSQEQDPVRNTFGAWQLYLSANARQRRDVQIRYVKHAKRYLSGFGELIRQLPRVSLAMSISLSRASPSLLLISFSSDCKVC